LGDGTTNDHHSPVQVSGLSGVEAIAGGMLHSLALKSNGTVWAWGYNIYGKLGDGTTITRDTPVQVLEDSDGDGITDWWTQLYFGHPTGLESDHSRAADDPDGDGMSNLQEYLTATDPTNGASALRITAIALEADDVRVTWTMGDGKTNALQATAGDSGGGFTNDFADLFTVTNTVGPATNYLDIGGATNFPSRFYRIRLVP
jgi:hypothetical protein